MIYAPLRNLVYRRNKLHNHIWNNHSFRADCTANMLQYTFKQLMNPVKWIKQQVSDVDDKH